MELENDNFSVIVPDYLINEENEDLDNSSLSDENEENENLDNSSLSDENEENENLDNSSLSEENEENEVQNEIDYTSILQEMNTRLENIETYTTAYNEGINGLLANLYFIDFVAFTVFVFLMLFVVIKFFKTFF